MFTHCNPVVNIMSQNNAEVSWSTSRSRYNSCFSKILHDPECDNQCCSNGFQELVQQRHYNELEQLLDVSTSNSDNSISTTSTFEIESFYNSNAINEVYVPEYQECILQVDMNMRPVYSETRNDGQEVRKKNFCKSQTKEQEVQKNNCKGVSKRKRKRTVFTTEQIIAMEGVFKRRPYVSREERLYLTRKLNVSEKAIKVWFQNRRRVTESRERDKVRAIGFELSEVCHSDSTVEEMYDDHSSRLDYIESQINKTTDEYGFVTLDNNSITELVNIIDSVLSQDIDHNSSPHQKHNSLSRSESYLMYEPISPESLPDTNRQTEDFMNWTPSKPEESLQRLIDIQSVLYV